MSEAINNASIGKEEYEKFDISWDFANDLGSGETISSDNIAVEAVDANGADASSVIITSESVSVSGSVISAKCQAGVVENSPYTIKFKTGATSADNQFQGNVVLHVA